MSNIINILELTNPNIARALKHLETISDLGKEFKAAYDMVEVGARDCHTEEALRSSYLEFLIMEFDSDVVFISDEEFLHEMNDAPYSERQADNDILEIRG